ncbi:MAG: ectoine hydroxylase [Candidimonas sp.]|nr:MAG: ectoine hydroxylase [Candidimonas sp.]
MSTTVSDVYVSRTDRDAAIVARQDPVIYGNGAYADALSGEQLAAYERDGFLLMRGLFSPDETRDLLVEVGRMRADPAIRALDEAVIEPRGRAIRSIFRVHRLSGAVARWVRDPRVVNVARQILGSEVYVHQSRANLKPGFEGKEFYWHSDFETWHVEDGMPRMRALSCSLLLTDNTACNGPLMLMPGSHQQFISCRGQTPHNNYQTSLRQQEYGVPDPVSLRLLADSRGVEAMMADAGSVVFFDCNTMHGSSGNISPLPRTNLFVVYNSVDNVPRDPQYGLEPRPEYIAARASRAPVVPLGTAPASYAVSSVAGDEPLEEFSCTGFPR